MKAIILMDSISRPMYSNGQTIANGVDLRSFDAEELQISAKLRTRPGSVNPDGTVVKSKRSATLLIPRTDDVTGVTTVDVGRIELETHPDLTSADLSVMRNAMGDMLTATAAGKFNLFWEIGNTDTDETV